MPAPGTRDAPKFDPDKESELLRFISRMEDLYSTHSITDDKEKIRLLGKYAPAETEAEWSAFDEYKAGAWKAFRDEVIKSYPEAAALERGSLLRFKKICAEKAGRHGIPRQDLHALLSLKRAFVAEAEKLLVTPALMSNKELVTEFLGCLSEEFQQRLKDKMDDLADAKGASTSATTATTAAGETRVEDRYKWKEVIETAVIIARRSSQPLERMSEDLVRGVSGERREDTIKMEETVARLADSLKIQQQQQQEMRQYSQVMDRRFEQLISAIKTQAIQPQAGTSQPYSYQQQYPRNNAYSPGASNSRQYPDGCYYCKEMGHRMHECPHALKHLDLKWIKRIDRWLKLPDGSPLPTDGEKSRKEVVEQLYKTRPGIIPMAKVNMQSFYQGSDQNQDMMLQDMQDPRVSQLLNGLAQLLGRETVDRMIAEEREPSPLDGIEEEEENCRVFE